MSSPIAVYLEDHLAGAQVALQVLKSMRDEQAHPKFRELAAELLPQVAKDDDTLRSILSSVGGTPSTSKQACGWLFEKLSRIKLGHAGSADFTLFESVELLTLGILGKLSLWKALEAVSAKDPALASWDFHELATRAQRQFERVESERLRLAAETLI